MRTLLQVQAKTSTTELTTQTFMGREYLVVPVVALVEGVVQGANATVPEFAPADEFAKFVDGWNGRPLMMNHPQVGGEYVSANSPEVLTDWSFGYIFGSIREDNSLKTQAWIDVARAAELGGDFQDVVDRLNNGEVIEVSTGLFVDMQSSHGTYNGKDYEAVWRDTVPDHLAMLPAGTVGACSIEDGCGAARQNTRRVSPQQCGGECDCNTCKEETMPAPVQVNKPVVEQPPIVHKAPTGFRDLHTIVANAIPNGMADIDARKVVARALRDLYSYSVYLIALTDQFAVYEAYDMESYVYDCYRIAYTVNEDTTVEFTSEAERVNILMNIVPVKVVKTTANAATTVVNLPKADDPSGKDEPMQGSTPAAAPKKKKPAGYEEGVEEDAVTGNTGAASTPVADPVLNNTGGIEGKMADEAQPNNTASAPAAPAPAANKGPTALADAVKTLSAEDQAQVAQGLALLKARKEEVIKALKDSGACDFSDEELAGMSINQLEKIAKLASNGKTKETPKTEGSFEGRAPAAPVTANADDGFAAPPKKAFTVHTGDRSELRQKAR